jgi:hypothetical protein
MPSKSNKLFYDDNIYFIIQRQNNQMKVKIKTLNDTVN